MPAARAADRATHARAALGAASGTLAPGKVSGAARHEGDLGEGCWGPRVLAGRGRGASGSLATRGPGWPAWTLVATWGLAGFQPVKDRRYPETEKPGDLGPLTWTPWEAVEVKVGKVAQGSGPQGLQALSLQKKCTCSTAGLIRVPALH